MEFEFRPSPAAQINAFMRHRQYDRALELLYEMYASDPESASAIEKITQCLIHLQNYEEALRWSDRLLALGEMSPRSYYDRATLLFKGFGRLEEAESCVREVIQLYSQTASGWGLLGFILLDKGDRAGAAEALEKGLAVNPEHIECLKLRMLLSSNPETALEEFQQHAMPENLERPEVWQAMSSMYIRTGDYDKARETAEEALRINPQDKFAASLLLEVIRSQNICYRAVLDWINGRDPLVLLAKDFIYRFVLPMPLVFGAVLWYFTGNRAPFWYAAGGALLLGLALPVYSIMFSKFLSWFHVMSDRTGRHLISPQEKILAVSIALMLITGIALLFTAVSFSIPLYLLVLSFPLISLLNTYGLSSGTNFLSYVLVAGLAGLLVTVLPLCSIEVATWLQYGMYVFVLPMPRQAIILWHYKKFRETTLNQQSTSPVEH